ncbi:DUF3040 domain-containing protein [Kitasatospora sp. NPDC006697]|uniref:DUF3040 domain-containing protein n=1 Tax=Kitasatospora sp. NPDC006697 TaxID=3364020 RepID=UPI0036B9D163
MDGTILSQRERRILAEIEAELRTDRRLDRALSSMRPRPVERLRGALRAAGRWPVAIAAVLVVLSASLALAAPRDHTPTALALFGAVWLVTLVVCGARLAARRADRRGDPL